VETDFAELPSVRCYAGDINQVLLNLVVNAAHAIGDNGASEDSLGRITVKTTLEGNNVVIAVTDTGIGIPDSVRDRIYDPFFTTKEVGRGTGQGLALAKTLVVDRHGGTLDVESVVGEGSTFTVRIPCAGARATAMTTA
jgi:signal transduction histidine kinase